MQRFQNILVGVDLSSGDRLATTNLGVPTLTAVDQALRLAERTKAKLTFFSAVEISVHAHEMIDRDRYHVTETVEEVAYAVLDDLVRQAAERGITAERKLAWGRDWQEIIKQVLRAQHDLVIVGTARHASTAGRLLFGSAGFKLLRKCPCPVLIPKPGPHPDVANILVPSDFSEVSADALQITVSGGQLVDARIFLLHAIELTPLDRHLFGHAEPSEVDRLRGIMHKEAEAKLKNQLNETDHRTLTHPVSIEVVDGPAEEAILEAVDRLEIDWLVMGTVGRSGIPGLLIGNVAERVISRLHCSLLAVKPHDFVSPIQLHDE